VTDGSSITPAPDNDLETRVTSLEHEVVRLREDAAEFRTQPRGHHHVLSALREIQLEQGQKIDEQGRETREDFATLATGIAQITTLRTTIAGSGMSQRPTSREKLRLERVRASLGAGEQP
jgi:hypothetical protein